ncbi:MAG: hypothetical protein PUF45_07865, partial [Lachnospiraceae bacterium]|nr:hypothetical protein [Lachnospiraceae bacterium]
DEEENVILDEDTPLNSGEEVEIEDAAAPLAPAAHNCFIHWIVFLLTLVCGAYSIVRVFARRNAQKEA